MDIGNVVMQTDKAAMLDEIIDYVKFLQLQMKVMYLLIWNFKLAGIGLG